MKAPVAIRRAGLATGAGCLLCVVGAVSAAPPADALAEAARLLADVKDHVFSFDDEAFYWFCKYVRGDGMPDAHPADENETPMPWQFLLERPSDYRGELVLVEGTLLRKTSFEMPNRPGVGTLYQCELTARGTGAVCTVILTDEPQGVPIHARVRGRAYFIKVRSFRTRQGGDGVGPLLVGRSLVRMGGGGSENVGPGLTIEDVGVWLAGATAVLAVAWFVLRRRLRAEPSVTEQSPSHAGIFKESDADYDWLLGDGDEGEPRTPKDD